MNEKTIWTRLINEGFTREGAAGLMGNLYAESMLNPQNLQNTFERKLGYSDATYTKAVDSTAYKNFVNDKAGYGLAQWTYYTRKQALLNFARSQNKSIGDLDMQLDFLMKELKESFSKVYNSLKTVTSVREASNIVLLQFEKPADQSNTVKNLRSSYAQKYYEQFANLVIKEEESVKEEEVKPVVEQTTSTLEMTATFAEATPKNNSSFLQPDSQVIMNGVIVNEYSLYKHNTKGISMPPLFKKKVIGVTIHNTEWINAATGTTPAEQYTRATRNGNMKDVRVHFYVDNVCAWQNLPYDYQGWHAADGSGNGNTATIAIECIMSSKYNDKDKRSEDNCARLAAALLKKYGLGINDLYTHTHWLNVRDGIKGTTDYLNTKKRANVKWCPCYLLPHWNDFKNKVLMYMGQTVEPQKPVDKPVDTPKPVTEVGTSFRITVQSNELNVRKDAGVEYPITTKIHKGEVYTIVDTKKSKDGGIWGKLKSGAGWINIGSAYVKK